VGFTSLPTRVWIRNGKRETVAVVISTIRSGQAGVGNALLIREKDGQLRVHSLSLVDLGMVLIYDPALAREPVREARVSKTVPVMLAKK
jgi:hypothetical protein